MPNRSDRSERLLTLLDKAWASQDADGYGALLEAARDYLFATGETAELAPDIPLASEPDPRVERQIEKLQSFLDQAKSANEGQGGTLNAQLVLAKSGRVTAMNPAAAALFAASPTHLDALDLDHAATKQIKLILSRLSQGVQPEEAILFLQSRDETRPLLALCQSVAIKDGLEETQGLQLSLSHIAWSETIVARLGQAMDLTPSETEILGLLLEGISQKDIALQRNRSLDTVKAQSKSILRKTGVAKATDLVQLCTGMAFLLRLQTDEGPRAGQVQTEFSLPLKDGRTLSYFRYGAPNGMPVLFFHGQLQGPFLTPRFSERLIAENITVIAPSRPGFGKTSTIAPRDRKTFEAIVVRDTLALVQHLGLDSLTVLALQGGVSHAFRTVAALGDRVSGMVMVDAGIPIDEAYIARMERQTQVAAYAVKYAPSVMSLLTRVAIATYEKRPEAFLRRLYADAPIDLATLREPDLMQVQQNGCEHLIAQGPHAFSLDGMSAMADWQSDFDAVKIAQVWLHPSDCPILPADFVAPFVEARTPYKVEVVPQSGYTLCHTHSDRVIDALLKSARRNY